MPVKSDQHLVRGDLSASSSWLTFGQANFPWSNSACDGMSVDIWSNLNWYEGGAFKTFAKGRAELACMENALMVLSHSCKCNLEGVK